MIKIKSPKDFCAGLMFVAFGAGGIWMAQSYPFGSAARMGPGYFPSLISGLLLILGGFVALRGLTAEGHKLGHFQGRPLVLVLASIVLFGIALERLGLGAAIFTLVILASIGGHEFRMKEVLVLAAFLAAGSVLLFVYGLRLPIPVWPFSY